jgi:hypothetical protein
VERAVTGEKKDGIKSAFFNFSKPELIDQYSQEKTYKKTNIAEKENFFSTLENKEKQTRFISDVDPGQNLKGKIGEENKARFISDVDVGQELNDNTKENKHFIRSEVKTIDVRYDNFVSRFSEITNEVKQNPSLGRDFLPNCLIDQVGKQISASILRGDKTVKLQLKPPELGTLRIEMDIKENVLKLGMITENGTTKELLLSNIQELRDSLVEQGVKLEKVDIQINYNFEQSLANSKEGTKEQRRPNQDIDDVTYMSKHNMENSASGNPVGIKNNNLLDLVA